jgi:hypothetical protein
MKTHVTLEYILPGKLEQISKYFSDFQLFGKYHPYMIEVIDLENTSASIKKYHVRESLKLWNLVPLRPRYEVDVFIIESEKHIRYKSKVNKGLFLEINYTFIEDMNTKTIKVLEVMLITGNPIINTIFVGILKRSRILMIESIRKELTAKHGI